MASPFATREERLWPHEAAGFGAFPITKILEIAVQNYSREFHNPQGVEAAVDPLPRDARPDIFMANVAAADDSRWVRQADGVDFLPLCFGVTQGYYANLLRVRKSGVLSCHKHFGAVHAYVIKGRWFYLEHEEMYTEGSFIMEPPGETHTLIVPNDVPEMITWFHAVAGYIYYDKEGRITHHEDVFTKLEAARRHYEALRLDQRELDRLIR